MIRAGAGEIPADLVIRNVRMLDVIGGEDFARQGNTDMDELLRNLVPSYNVNPQSISDAATLIRPAKLRGLPPAGAGNAFVTTATAMS